MSLEIKISFETNEKSASVRILPPPLRRLCGFFGSWNFSILSFLFWKFWTTLIGIILVVFSIFSKPTHFISSEFLGNNSREFLCFFFISPFANLTFPLENVLEPFSRIFHFFRIFLPLTSAIASRSLLPSRPGNRRKRSSFCVPTRFSRSSGPVPEL